MGGGRSADACGGATGKQCAPGGSRSLFLPSRAQKCANLTVGRRVCCWRRSGLGFGVGSSAQDGLHLSLPFHRRNAGNIAQRRLRHRQHGIRTTAKRYAPRMKFSTYAQTTYDTVERRASRDRTIRTNLPSKKGHAGNLMQQVRKAR